MSADPPPLPEKSDAIQDALASLHQLLRRLELEHHAGTLISHGFDSVKSILSLTVSDLDTLPDSIPFSDKRKLLLYVFSVAEQDDAQSLRRASSSRRGKMSKALAKLSKESVSREKKREKSDRHRSGSSTAASAAGGADLSTTDTKTRSGSSGLESPSMSSIQDLVKRLRDSGNLEREGDREAATATVSSHHGHQSGRHRHRRSSKKLRTSTGKEGDDDNDDDDDDDHGDLARDSEETGSAALIRAETAPTFSSIADLCQQMRDQDALGVKVASASATNAATPVADGPTARASPPSTRTEKHRRRRVSKTFDSGSGDGTAAVAVSPGKKASSSRSRASSPKTGVVPPLEAPAPLLPGIDRLPPLSPSTTSETVSTDRSSLSSRRGRLSSFGNAVAVTPDLPPSPQPLIQQQQQQHPPTSVRRRRRRSSASYQALQADGHPYGGPAGSTGSPRSTRSTPRSNASPRSLASTSSPRSQIGDLDGSSSYAAMTAARSRTSSLSVITRAEAEPEDDGDDDLYANFGNAAAAAAAADNQQQASAVVTSPSSRPGSRLTVGRISEAAGGAGPSTTPLTSPTASGGSGSRRRSGSTSGGGSAVVPLSPSSSSRPRSNSGSSRARSGSQSLHEQAARHRSSSLSGTQQQQQQPPPPPPLSSSSSSTQGVLLVAGSPPSSSSSSVAPVRVLDRQKSPPPTTPPLGTVSSETAGSEENRRRSRSLSNVDGETDDQRHRASSGSGVRKKGSGRRRSLVVPVSSTGTASDAGAGGDQGTTRAEIRGLCDVCGRLVDEPGSPLCAHCAQDGDLVVHYQAVASSASSATEPGKLSGSRIGKLALPSLRRVSDAEFHHVPSEIIGPDTARRLKEEHEEKQRRRDGSVSDAAGSSSAAATNAGPTGPVRSSSVDSSASGGGGGGGGVGALASAAAAAISAAISGVGSGGDNESAAPVDEATAVPEDGSSTARKKASWRNLGRAARRTSNSSKSSDNLTSALNLTGTGTAQPPHTGAGAGAGAGAAGNGRSEGAGGNGNGTGTGTGDDNESDSESLETRLCNVADPTLQLAELRDQVVLRVLVSGSPPSAAHPLDADRLANAGLVTYWTFRPEATVTNVVHKLTMTSPIVAAAVHRRSSQATATSGAKLFSVFRVDRAAALPATAKLSTVGFTADQPMTTVVLCAVASAAPEGAVQSVLADPPPVNQLLSETQGADPFPEYVIPGSHRKKEDLLLVILRKPPLREAFRRFLVRQFQTENFYFFLSVEAYRDLGDDQAARGRRAQQLWDLFVARGSSNEINLPAKLRKQLEQDLASPPPSPAVFDHAQAAVAELLRTNSVRPWVSSVSAKELESIPLFNT